MTAELKKEKTVVDIVERKAFWTMCVFKVGDGINKVDLDLLHTCVSGPANWLKAALKRLVEKGWICEVNPPVKHFKDSWYSITEKGMKTKCYTYISDFVRFAKEGDMCSTRTFDLIFDEDSSTETS